MMQRILLPHTVWILVFLLIPSIAIGFYPRYFSKPMESIHWMVHAHFFFMLLWAGLSIIQPILIHRKNFKLHRRLGKISYWIMPLLVLSMYWVLQTGYEKSIYRLKELVASGKSTYTEEQIRTLSANWIGQSLDDFFILTILYLLAIAYRKKVLHHATFMMGAICTILGPSLGRAIPFIFRLLGFSPGLVSSIISEVLVIFFFLFLAFYQKSRGFSIQPALLVIGMFSVSIFFTLVPYEVIPNSKKFIEWFLMV